MDDATIDNNIVNSGNIVQDQEVIIELQNSVDSLSAENAELKKEISNLNKSVQGVNDALNAPQMADEVIEADEDQQVEEEDLQTESYTEVLSDGLTAFELNNELLATQNIWFGVIAGLLFIKILVDRLIRN